MQLELELGSTDIMFFVVAVERHRLRMSARSLNAQQRKNGQSSRREQITTTFEHTRHACHLIYFQCASGHVCRMRRKPFFTADRSWTEKRKAYQRQPITSVGNVSLLFYPSHTHVLTCRAWSSCLVCTSYDTNGTSPVALLARSLDCWMISVYLLT